MLLALALAVTAAGCGGGSHKHTQTGSSGRPNSTSNSKTTTTTPARTNGIATAQAVVGDPGGQVRMKVTVYDLRRLGPFAVLDFGYSCVAPASGCDATGVFAIPENKESGTQFAVGSDTPNGVSLVDPIGNRQYLPVTDAQQRPATSTLSFHANPGATYLAYVKFPAPPSTVTSLNVLFPNGGPTITGVPISSTLATPPASAAVVAAAPSPFATKPESTDTTGLTLPVENLVLTSGNPSGSDAESPSRSTVTLRTDVLFHFAKSNLTARAHAILDSVAAKIKARATGPVSVTGYTDSIGPDSVNIPLSRARAASVVAALKPLTPGVVYVSSGRGSSDPVAPNTKPNGSDNPAGRALNRRVTISFAVKAPTKPTPPAAPATSSQQPGASAQTATYVASNGLGTSTYSIEVNRLFRDGDLALAELTVTCERATGQYASSGCSGQWDFAGSATTPPIPVNQSNAISDYNNSAANAFYLVDRATGTQYIPVTNTSGFPLTASTNQFDWPPGTSYPLWVYFPAPPGASTTLVFPGAAGSIPQVPIASSP
jgi:OOP family OmpA-OmpF porin